MGKCTVLNNRCGARDSQLVSKIFAEGSGAQVPTMEEPEVKVGQSDVTQTFQFALEAKDMELNSLRHKIDGMENQLTMLAAKRGATEGFARQVYRRLAGRERGK